MKLCVKLHKAYRTVVAVCDQDILGQKYEEGIKQLEVRKNFFHEKEISFDEAISMMKFHSREDATFNIVGKHSIEAAKKAGIISEDYVGHVQGIPFALVLI